MSTAQRSSLVSPIALWCLLVLSGAPLVAHCSLRITEVMYDPLGSDTGHEWVEVTNIGQSPVTLTNFTFLESGVGHKLTLVSKTPELAPHQSAIFAQNPEAFAGDQLNYLGPLYKVSFSLVNSREALGLRDASSSVVETVTYSSTFGAHNDGMSLHRLLSGSFVAGAPDPGEYTGVAPVALVRTVAEVPTVANTPTQVTQKVVQKTLSHVATTSSPNSSVFFSSTTQLSSTTSLVLQTDTRVFIEAVVGLTMLVVLGVLGVWYAYTQELQDFERETPLMEDEFEIESD